MRDTTTTAAPMAPGIYLQKRREAAGLSIDDVVQRLKVPAWAHPEFRKDLLALEQGAELPNMLASVRLIFPFDGEAYHALLAHAADPASELPIPEICRGCGCTWYDACPDDGSGQPCSWAEPGLCSTCKRKEPANEA